MWSYHNVNDPACEAGLCGCESHRPPQILEDTAKWLAIRFEPGGVRKGRGSTPLSSSKFGSFAKLVWQRPFKPSGVCPLLVRVQYGPPSSGDTLP